MTKRLEEKIYNDKEFQEIVKELIENETVLKMKRYRQHLPHNGFDQCLQYEEQISHAATLPVNKHIKRYVNSPRA